MKCIYHADCFDGLAAAMLVSEAFPEVECVPAHYGATTLPEYTPGETVFIVDFSYTGEVLESHFAQAGRVILIDHHISAIRKLEQYRATRPAYPANVEVHLSTQYSGATLTWKVLHGDKPMPLYLKHFENHDLWRYDTGCVVTHPELPNTEAFIARVGLLEQTLTAWQAYFNAEFDYQRHLREGRLLLELNKQLVNWHVTKGLNLESFDGYRVPVLNVPRYLTSRVGNQLASHYPFVVLYFDVGTTRTFSLRSDQHIGLDVSVIAERHGGGGHKNAAGFTRSIDSVVV